MMVREVTAFAYVNPSSKAEDRLLLVDALKAAPAAAVMSRSSLCWSSYLYCWW